MSHWGIMLVCTHATHNKVQKNIQKHKIVLGSYFNSYTQTLKLKDCNPVPGGNTYRCQYSERLKA